MISLQTLCYHLLAFPSLFGLIDTSTQLQVFTFQVQAVVLQGPDSIGVYIEYDSSGIDGYGGNTEG